MHAEGSLGTLIYNQFIRVFKVLFLFVVHLLILVRFVVVVILVLLMGFCEALGLVKYVDDIKGPLNGNAHTVAVDGKSKASFAVLRTPYIRITVELFPDS